MQPDREKLKKEQTELSKKIITTDQLEKINLYAGVDVAYSDDTAFCAIVVCNREMEVIEEKTAVADVKIPYMPGYLFYREGPIILEAFQKIENRPDVILCGFNGILHPRRLGAASHLGLVLDIPTIGIAKNLMCGKLDGDAVVMDKEVRGTALETKAHAKPIFISPGHKISLKKSVEIVRKCMRNPHKLPEPLHLAHQKAKQEKNLVKD
jgi:deoxyribonuclease V